MTLQHRLPSRSIGRLAAALLTAAPALALILSLSPATARAQQKDPESYPASIAVKKPVTLPGTVVIPTSSQINAVDKGKRARTNFRYILPALLSPAEAPPYSNYGYETPSSLACLYNIVTPITGCNPNLTTAVPSGGSGSIAIVDAYDDPEAAADLAYFSAQFGLPFSPQKFQVVYESTTGAPPVDETGGWEMEESLDIEYAHAMAPNATLYLVEANSNSFTDLFAAVALAENLIHCGARTCTTTTGKGEISMSWGGQEFSTETTYDKAFLSANVVSFAAAGDSAGTSYPCVSPNVVCAGGTTTARSLATGNLIQEIAWSDAGGGISLYEPIPTYQSAVSSIVGKYRGVPDLSSDANPTTGMWVYDSFPMDGEYGGNWWIVGGTSAASPLLAGITNAAGHFYASSSAELTVIYANRATKTDFNDITYGACGYYSNAFSATGWDLCTGVGSPYGLAGK